MIIITALKLLPEVVMHAHSINMDISETTIDDVIHALDDEAENGDHQGRLYCWPNNNPEEVVPQEAERVMGYKDLCAEEYELYSLESGDVVYFFSEVYTDSDPKIVWHMATFDSIER
jgi:hypothetical protein